MLVSFCVLIIFLTRDLTAAPYFTTSAKYGIIGEPFHFFCTTNISYCRRLKIYRNRNYVGTCPRNSNRRSRYSVECNYLYENEAYNITLTIPGQNMTDVEDQSVWYCLDRDPDSISPIFRLKVKVPVDSVTISPKANSSKQSLVDIGQNTTIQCHVTGVRPPAKIQWFIDSERVYDRRLFTVRVTGSDMTRYNVTSTLSLRFEKYKNIRKVQCFANNMENETATKSDETNIEFMYPPSESPVIEGYDTGHWLFINDPPLSLVCKVETSWPKPSLDFVCLGQRQITEDTKDYVVRRITVDVSAQLNGKSCACIATHPVEDYRKKTQIIFTIIDPAKLRATDDTPELVYDRFSIVLSGAVLLILIAAIIAICGCKCLRNGSFYATNQHEKATTQRPGMEFTTHNYEVPRRKQPSAGPSASSNYEMVPRVTEESEDHIYSVAT